MNLSHWYKKDVVLDWQGGRMSFAVSQSLFSSHDIDAGSRLLLRSLDVDTLPVQGRAIDFGCGYGTLGLALKQVRPEWRIELIDRDALAVALSRWNGERFGSDEEAGLRFRVGLGVESAHPEGVDLLLWNVPGKAGPRVLTRLASDAIGALANQGVLALVIVNPLAEEIRAAIAVDDTISMEVDSTFADHTVMLARRNEPLAAATRQGDSPFARGVFDRAPRRFEWRDLAYAFTPVMGLAEYDSRDFATDCALDVINGLDLPVERAILQGVGQGHLPVLVAAMHRPRVMELFDRDLLALKASQRAVSGAEVPPSRILIDARVDPGVFEPLSGATVATLMLPDQQAPDVTAVQIRDLSALAGATNMVVVAGRSTSVTRFLALALHTRGWRLRKRRKRHGASAALLSIDGG